jgi:hypothetical protein
VGVSAEGGRGVVEEEKRVGVAGMGLLPVSLCEGLGLEHVGLVVKGGRDLELEAVLLGMLRLHPLTTTNIIRTHYPFRPY